MISSVLLKDDNDNDYNDDYYLDYVDGNFCSDFSAGLACLGQPCPPPLFVYAKGFQSQDTGAAVALTLEEVSQSCSFGACGGRGLQRRLLVLIAQPPPSPFFRQLQMHAQAEGARKGQRVYLAHIFEST